MSVKWDRAYYLPEDKEGVDADYVLQKRDSGIPLREGDCWSSKAQYLRGTGVQLNVFDMGGLAVNHFRSWPREYKTKRWEEISLKSGIDCSGMNRIEHIHRYNQFFEDFLEALKSDKEIRDLFYVAEVFEISERKRTHSPDIEIIHRDGFYTERTFVSIIDKYRVRDVKSTHGVFTIDMTKWRTENCLNFEDFGRMLSIRAWERYMSKFTKHLSSDGNPMTSEELPHKPKDRELSKRDEELLHLIKQHTAILGPTGITASDYSFMDLPKGGGRRSLPLGAVESDMEKAFLSKVENDIIDLDLVEHICKVCMGHNKYYFPCANSDYKKIQSCTPVKERERYLEGGYKYDDYDRFSHRGLDPRVASDLDELREEEKRNPVVTEFCSQCTVILDEHCEIRQFTTRNRGFPAHYDWLGSKIRNKYPYKTILLILDSILPASIERDVGKWRYYQPFTVSQLKKLINEIEEHPKIRGLKNDGLITNHLSFSDIASILGVDSIGGGEAIEPKDFYTPMPPDFTCPKCKKRGKNIGTSVMSFKLSCGCNQGRAAVDCGNCEHGTARPNMHSYHIRLKCHCSREYKNVNLNNDGPNAYGINLLVKTTIDESRKLSIECADCGFMLLGDDYFVGEISREFWFCRSASRMLTDEEYDEFLYARHGSVLEDWFVDNAWQYQFSNV